MNDRLYLTLFSYLNSPLCFLALKLTRSEGVFAQVHCGMVCVMCGNGFCTKTGDSIEIRILDIKQQVSSQFLPRFTGVIVCVAKQNAICSHN